MFTPSQKGSIAETAIVAAAIKLGIHVFKPVNEGLRYDLIFEISGSFARAFPHHRVIQLRVGPTHNNQRRGINWAEAYEFSAKLGSPGAVAQLGERADGIREVRGSIPLGSNIPISRGHTNNQSVRYEPPVPVMAGRGQLTGGAGKWMLFTEPVSSAETAQLSRLRPRGPLAASPLVHAFQQTSPLPQGPVVTAGAEPACDFFARLQIGEVW